MERKGFFCFSLAIIFALAAFNLSEAAAQRKEKLLEAKTIAVSLEQGNLKRFEIETNADKAIAFSLEQSLKGGELSHALAKQTANLSLWQLLQEEKQVGNQKIEFFSGNSLSDNQINAKKILGLLDLEENSKTIVLAVNNIGFEAQYGFTGGLLREKKVIGKIESEKTGHSFELPPGYAQTVMVVK